MDLHTITRRGLRWLDQLELYHDAQHRAESDEAETEILAADLAGGLESGVASPVKNVSTPPSSTLKVAAYPG